MNLNLTATQVAKMNRNQPFQLNARQLQAEGNNTVSLQKRAANKVKKAMKNNTGVRITPDMLDGDNDVDGGRINFGKLLQRGSKVSRASNALQSGQGVGSSKVAPQRSKKMSAAENTRLIMRGQLATQENNRVNPPSGVKTAAKQRTGGAVKSPAKGSQAAKDKMAKLRAMRKGKGLQAADSESEDDEIDGGKFRLGRKINKAFSRKKVRKGLRAAKKGVVDTYRSKEFKQVADIGTDVALAYGQSQGYVSKDQAKDARKFKKAAIHEDVDGMKKAARDAALNEGKRQAGEQLKGRGLANPVINEDAAGGNSIILSGRRNGGSFRALGTRRTRGGSFLPH